MAHAEVCKGARLASLFLLFQDSKPRHTQQLAKSLGVARRTIQRDLLDLQGKPFYVPLVLENKAWRRI